MSLNSLFDHFDSYTVLPIFVDDIRDQIVDCGYQDHILFHAVSMDALRVRGFLYRYIRRPGVYAEPEYHAEICYAEEMELEWSRLSCTKELVHIVETTEESARTRKEISELIDKITLPLDIPQESNESFTDKTTLILALGILVPDAARSNLRLLFDKEILSGNEVALLAQIPQRYGKVVMSDIFEELLAVMKGK